MSADYYEEEEFASEFKGQTFKRILALAKPHRQFVTGFLLAAILVSVLDAYFTFLSKRIVDEGIVAGNLNALNAILIQYGSLILIQAAAVFCFIYLVGIVGERIRYDLRQQLFNHLQILSLSYYSRTPVGWIIARVTNDTERVAELVTWGVLDSTWGLVNILTAMSFMAVINWKLAMIVFAALPVMFIVAIEFRKRILRQYRNVRKFNSKIVGTYNENITGVEL